MTVDALHVARALVDEDPLHAVTEEVGVQTRSEGGLDGIRRRDPVGHCAPFRVLLRFEELPAHMERRPACRLHERLSQEPAAVGVAGRDQTGDDLEVPAGILFRPEHLSAGGLAQPLQAQGRALLGVAGDAGRPSGAPSAPVGQEDGLDRFAVVLEAQRRLACNLAGTGDRRDERDGKRQA